MNTEGKVAVASQGGTSWSLPKGHVEEGEDAMTAARREIAEETGITQLEYVKDLGRYARYRIGADGKIDDASELKHMIMFLFKTGQTALHPTDPDNPEARWVDKNKVAELLTHPKDKEFFEKVVGEL